MWRKIRETYEHQSEDPWNDRSDSYLPCKRLQEWWKIHPTYDQGNRLSADVFDACAFQRVCKDPSLWTCPHYRLLVYDENK